STFAPDVQEITKNHVPIEAKISVAFMNAMSNVGKILDSALVRFAMLFILIAYAFWIGIEAYNMMTTGGDAKKLVYDLLIKGAKISVWLIIIAFGPAKIFMWVMGPVLSVGTYMANMILNAVLGAAGVSMPDTCASIAQYASQNINPDTIIDAAAASDIICLPTRVSEFFRTTLALGFKWIAAGIGRSLLTFIAGIALIIMSIRCIWKFLFMALNVVADLFLTVLMLPFTAIAETTSKTQYKGIVGDIFNTFMGLFAPESLDTQIKKFISAALYFVSLAIVIGVCVALLSGVFNANLFSIEPTVDAGGFIITLLVLRLVEYMADKADKYASDWAGKIQGDFGNKVQGDIKGLWNDAVKQYKAWQKAIQDSKKP
ncbi:MAG: hypothetical protein ACLRFJ_02965, partial [Alphaproteobacteria bacterium]